jgi:NADH-quinone oxidoreductase subunit M
MVSACKIKQTSTVPSIMKLWLPISFFTGIFLQLTNLYLFLTRLSWDALNSEHISVSYTVPYLGLKYSFLSLDLFGAALILLAYIVGFLSLFNFNDKVFWVNLNQSLLFNYFIVIVIMFACCDNTYLFFILYELLLLPSFIIVYYNSPNKKGIQASLYFLIWTQLGSLLVFLVIMYMVNVSGVSTIDQLRNFTFSSEEVFYLQLVLFLGFGFKIPIWPFHYWLTKTHVEAPGSFSMYLSGFLVKTALFGLYKLFLALNFPSSNIILLAVASVGVIDASLKMWTQVDLKKLVAFCTIQEMNLIVMCFLFGYSPIVSVGIIFCFMHAILSSLMFFLVDCVQRRFQSRQTAEVTGLIHSTPNLGLSVIFMVLMYLAIPGTLKFSCEFMLFCYISDISFILFFLVLVSASTIAPVAFAKIWYGCVFGAPKHKALSYNDLSHKEITIVLLCLSLLIMVSAFFYNYF